jgi:hypothetical protein
MKYAYTLFLILLQTICSAQTDTVAYNAQRVKINNLLAQRSQKFGNYYESLNKKTGIFGWQTKKDIRNSNEILRAIVLNDNNIFAELKILMDYKDLQTQQKATVVDDSKERIGKYMLTIKKLQDQNEKLKFELKSNSNNSSMYIIILLLLIIFIAGYYFYIKLNKNHPYEKSIF